MDLLLQFKGSGWPSDQLRSAGSSFTAGLEKQRACRWKTEVRPARTHRGSTGVYYSPFSFCDLDLCNPFLSEGGWELFVRRITSQGYGVNSWSIALQIIIIFFFTRSLIYLSRGCSILCAVTAYLIFESISYPQCFSRLRALMHALLLHW